MIHLAPTKPKPRTIPDWPARSVLLDFIRAHAPDLRILVRKLDDGHRACLACFTFRGEYIEVEAIEGDVLPKVGDGPYEPGACADPDDAVVRRASWVVYARLGIGRPMSSNQRTQLEKAIVDASMRGDTATADRLGLELALLNEGVTTPQDRIRVKPSWGI